MLKNSSFLVVLIAAILTACSAQATVDPAPASPQLAETLIFYDWAEDMPQSVLDAFTEEYGVQVDYQTYETQEEALANLRAGNVYDVLVLDNDIVTAFVQEGLLAEIDYRNVPNFKNISPNFRDLAYDPGNKHAVPWNWGTTGLIVRTDLVEEPITSWNDLWDTRYAGKVAVRQTPREVVAVTLKSLGYSINSEDPAELQAARERLLALKDSVVFVETYAEGALPLLLNGEVVMMVGWAEDILYGREESESLAYVLPEEGTLLWGDNFVIPANSPRNYTAEVFINFLMRPEINAQIVNENYYATANEAARAFIGAEIIDDSAIFPPDEDITNAEVYLPLSPAGEQKHNEIFDEFVASKVATQREP